MRTFLFIVLTLISLPTSIKSQWFLKQNVEELLFSVRFATSDIGFIGGRNGLLLKTTDGGGNWVETTPITSNDLEDIFFINENKGWIAGERGTVLITSDGGENWDSIKTNIKKRFFAINFVTENYGWIASEDAIFKSTDGGLNWEMSKYQDTTYYYSVYFANKDTGWVAGDSAAVGIILRTTDSGVSWHKQFDTPQLGLLSTILFIEDSIGYAFGENGAMAKSTDFGSSWVLLTPNIFINDNWESAFFINRNVGWIAGGSSNIIDKTTDGGRNWDRQLYEPSGATWLFSVFFKDSLNGWAVGAGENSSQPGEILQTTNGGITFVKNEIDIEVTEFKLFQNYPNPFNPTTKIKYSIPSSAIYLPTSREINLNITLKVYDVLGNEVANLVNEYKPAGSYEVDFNASSLSSGIYFYQLKSGNFLETKKMTLLK